MVKNLVKYAHSNMTDKQEKKSTDRAYHLFALKIIGDFGVSIAVPVVVFVLIGQYFDEKYNNSPIFTILAFALAALLSAKMIHKKAKLYGKQYQSLVDKDLNNKEK